VSFQVEYYDTGLLRVLSFSGPVLEQQLVPYSNRDESEIRIVVSVDERWMQPGLAPMTVAVSKGGTEPLWIKTFHALDSQRDIRGYVGMVQEGK